MWDKGRKMKMTIHNTLNKRNSYWQITIYNSMRCRSFELGTCQAFARYFVMGL